MKRFSLRYFLFRFLCACVVLVLAGCRLDWNYTPPSGYSVLSGSLRQPDGSVWLPAGVFFMCGETGADGFGWDVSVRPEGKYRIEVEAPEGYGYSGPTGSTFLLRCSVNAPVQSRAALRYVAVTFSRAKGERQGTSIDLINGQRDTLPAGWTGPLLRSSR